MKRFSQLLIIILITGLMLSQTAAQDIATPSSGTQNDPEKKTRQIEDLKERLATKVAELRETKPAALHGTITNITLTTVSVETKTKEVKIELTDGIKIVKYVKNKRTEMDAEDLAKGDQVSVIGEYDTTLDVLKGKIIILEAEQPGVLYGTIIDTNEENYTVTIKTSGAKNYLLDYERSTATSLWKDGEITKGGFSKLVAGDTVAVSGYPVANADNRFTAVRILSLGTLDGAKQPENTATESAAASE